MISRTTLEALAAILRKHLTTSQIIEICRDLENVRGNQSFRDSIEALVKELTR